MSIPSRLARSFAMSELKQRFTTAVKSELYAKDKTCLKTLRMVLGTIKQQEIDERIELSDAQALSVLQKMVKQRRDSIAQFLSAKRADLVAQEEAELAILQSYLPAQMSDAEVQSAVAQVLAEFDAPSMKEMGRIMAILKAQLNGKADMSAVAARIKSQLA